MLYNEKYIRKWSDQMESVFYYGVMKASKSAQLILQASTYQQQGITPIIIKPTTDTRNGSGKVHSRIGIQMPVTYTVKHDDTDTIHKAIKEAVQGNQPIFVDEAQFFSPEVIQLLTDMVHEEYPYNIEHNHRNLYFYGLLKTYNNELFEGSKALVENVDKFVEIKTKCEFDNCNRKATCNYLNSDPQKGKNNVIIGDSKYSVYCQTHFKQLMGGD